MSTIIPNGPKWVRVAQNVVTDIFSEKFRNQLFKGCPVAPQGDSHRSLKGKLGDFFYLFKVFIGPKLRQVSVGNFHRKAPKWVKNQAKGSKIHKIRTLLLILASDLLWESINSGVRPTVGIWGIWLTHRHNSCSKSRSMQLRAAHAVHKNYATN